jgi:uncharacterized iron-regulated protein
MTVSSLKTINILAPSLKKIVSVRRKNPDKNNLKKKLTQAKAKIKKLSKRAQKPNTALFSN